MMVQGISPVLIWAINVAYLLSDPSIERNRLQQGEDFVCRNSDFVE